MIRRHTLAVLTLLGAGLVFASASARADLFVDDFEGGSNTAGWAYIQGFDVIEAAGGNPGGWLHQSLYDTFDPAVRCAVDGGTPFTGDYRAAGVTKISFDLQTLGLDFGDGSGFEIVLQLRNVNGTPDDVFDDDFAYAIGAAAPIEGAGWVHYEFAVPSGSNEAVPAGWTGASIEDCENFRAGVTWANLMESVNQVEIHYLTPCLFAIFQQWNVGVDNIAIEYAENPTSVESTSWAGIKNLYR